MHLITHIRRAVINRCFVFFLNWVNHPIFRPFPGILTGVLLKDDDPLLYADMYIYIYLHDMIIYMYFKYI